MLGAFSDYSDEYDCYKIVKARSNVYTPLRKLRIQIVD